MMAVKQTESERVNECVTQFICPAILVVERVSRGSLPKPPVIKQVYSTGCSTNRCIMQRAIIRLAKLFERHA